MPDLPRLKAMLDVPELAWLVRRLRRRYESGNSNLNSPVTLQNSSEQQRQRCDRLLGRKPTAGRALSVRPDELERLLMRAGVADSLRDAIESLTGPIVDLRAEQQLVRSAWAELFDRARSRVSRDPARQEWLDDLRKTGVLRKLSSNDVERARALLDVAIDVVNRLPHEGITLAQLAAETCGDSHALDTGQPLATLALRAAARVGDALVQTGTPHVTDRNRPYTAQERRRVWDRVGVICDELSSPVLALNLKTHDGQFTERLLSLAAAEGEPCRITARQLLRHPPRFDVNLLGTDVYVCENPSVLAAAANALGVACRPLVCIDGQPTTAAHLLLAALARANVTFHYHGDFDWGGLRIANAIIARYNARPWRMSSSDYLAAAPERGVRLKPRAVQASWDASLSLAMLERGVAVHEEQVVGNLISDLRSE